LIVVPPQASRSAAKYGSSPEGLAPERNRDLVGAGARGHLGDAFDRLGVGGERGGVVRRVADEVGPCRERPFLVFREEVEALGHLGRALTRIEVGAGGGERQPRGADGAETGDLEQGAAPHLLRGRGVGHVIGLSIVLSGPSGPPARDLKIWISLQTNVREAQAVRQCLEAANAG
jgi:hypothetical protein